MIKKMETEEKDYKKAKFDSKFGNFLHLKYFLIIVIPLLLISILAILFSGLTLTKSIVFFVMFFGLISTMPETEGDYYKKRRLNERLNTPEKIIFYIKAMKNETDYHFIKEMKDIVDVIISQDDNINKLKSSSNIVFSKMHYLMTNDYSKRISIEQYEENIKLLKELNYVLMFKLKSKEKKEHSLENEKELTLMEMETIELRKKSLLKEISLLDHENELLKKKVTKIDVNLFYKENEMFEENEENLTETL